MPLVNHAFARGTPAIFVIFVVPRGLSSKTHVSLVRAQIRHFRRFRQKPPLFGGTKAQFTKSTVSCTLIHEESNMHRIAGGPFCVAFTPLFPKVNLPFSGTCWEVLQLLQNLQNESTAFFPPHQEVGPKP